MKKAIMYGAGNIGRGFIGKTFSESGYEVCFLDISETIIAAFNEKNEYSVRIVENDTIQEDIVKNIRAINAQDLQAIKEISETDIMATAVGARVLPHIAKNIAEGIKERIKTNNKPLNIILAENKFDVDKLMKEYIYDYLNDSEKLWADTNLGLVQASIGRMVPPPTTEEISINPLFISVEKYSDLPVDKAAFKGEIPEINGLIPYTPFSFYIKRKLYIHNMAHALCAYFGNECGYEYIWQAIEDDTIYKKVHDSMQSVALALHKEYGVPLEKILANVDDLLNRFKNKALKDTILRVGADPIRKINKDDRLVGAALYCAKEGIDNTFIVEGIASALKFNKTDDSSSVQLQKDLANNGIEHVIEICMGLSLDSDLARSIKKLYETI